MEKILKKYQELCDIKSDINEHLPILKEYAEKCKHITEMGTRYVVSTWAFLASNPEKLICYDILTGLNMDIFNKNISEISECSKEENIEFIFDKKDVLAIEIEETDLLFIDTYHIYEQLSKELSLHASKAKKYIILHDTTTFAIDGENQKHGGIWKAVEEFLYKNEDWKIEKRFENNNGLTILKRHE